MTDGRVDLLLRLRDEMSKGIRAAAAQVASFGHRTDALMRGAGRGVQYLAGQLNGLGTIAGLIGGGAIGRQLIDFDTNLRTLSNTARISDDRMGRLREQLLALSGLQTGQLGGELLGGLSQLVEAGMDLDTAVEMLLGIGRAATATRSDINDLALTAFYLNRTLGIAPEDMEETLGGIAAVANTGLFSLKDMAQYLPRAAAGLANLGASGKDAAAVLAASMQIGMLARGDAAEATTAYMAFMRELISKSAELKDKLGVDVFTVDESGVKKIKELPRLYKEIADASGGDVVKLQSVFGDEALMFIMTMVREMEQFDALLASAGTGGELVNGAFERQMAGTAEQIEAARAELEKFVQVGTGGLLMQFSGLLRILNQHPAAIRAIAASLIVLASITAANKAGTWIGGLIEAVRGTAGGKGTGGAGAGGLAAGMATPVFVTNWPTQLGGAAAGPLPPGPPGAPRPPRPRGRFGPTVGEAGPQATLAAIGAGWETGTAVGDVAGRLLNKTGATGVLQKDMARWMAVFGGDAANDLMAETDPEWKDKGWLGKLGSAAWHTNWLIPEMILPEKLGGLTDEEIADAQAAFKASRVNISMTMLVLDDRIQVTDVAGVDDLEVMTARI